MSASPYIYRVTLARHAPVRMETWDAQGREGDSFEGPQLSFDGRAPPEVEDLLQAVYARQAPERQTLKQLGNALSRLVFNDLLRNKLLKRYVEVSNAKESHLRLELVMPRDDEALAALPWEFLCIPGGQFGADLWPGAMPHIVFSRRLGGLRTDLRELEPGEKLRILVVICDPGGVHPQADAPAVDDAPLRQQLQALARQEPDLFAPPVFLVNRDRDAIDRALEDEPHFFHFIGHTRVEEQTQQVALAGPAGQARWIDVDQMTGLFARHLPSVVLFQPGNEAGNRAPGALAALARRAIEANVPAAVGMQYHVLPANGYRFATEFYRQVAHGQPIDVAVQEARYKLSDLFESREFASPVLYLRVKDSHLFHRKPQAPVRVDAPQAAQLRQSLMLLDYNPLQRTFDRATVRKGSRVEAMLVTGRPRTGKRWFVRRVLESLQRGPGGEPWIKLDLQEIFIFEVTVRRLWDVLAAHHLDMPEGAPVDEIIEN
ncbi:MAG TPA: CHAT domain-containing protein, partial [Candidatus Sulfomarinibacteraceae bacterium]|nr:CHAT domain-containing protein [Candidatus Sulfomarinibacteraceae bacterium]